MGVDICISIYTCVCMYVLYVYIHTCVQRLEEISFLWMERPDNFIFCTFLYFPNFTPHSWITLMVGKYTASAFFKIKRCERNRQVIYEWRMCERRQISPSLRNIWPGPMDLGRKGDRSTGQRWESQRERKEPSRTQEPREHRRASPCGAPGPVQGTGLALTQTCCDVWGRPFHRLDFKCPHFLNGSNPNWSWNLNGPVSNWCYIQWDTANNRNTFRVISVWFISRSMKEAPFLSPQPHLMCLQRQEVTRTACLLISFAPVSWDL